MSEEQLEIEAYDEHDNLIFGVVGPEDRVRIEIEHYRSQYEEDGPVRLERIIRVPYELPNP